MNKPDIVCVRESVSQAIDDAGLYRRLTLKPPSWLKGIQPADDPAVLFFTIQGENSEQVYRLTFQESDRKTMEAEAVETRLQSEEAGFANC